MKTEQIIDWYWEHGAKRADNYALAKGDWLDKVYGIAERRRKFEASAAGARSTLAIWGPSQTGKSTLFSRHLDVGKTPERGSPCLTWDDAAPTVFQEAVGGQISLNPYNHGGDGTGCATRYALVGQVKHPRHPVALRLNTLGEVMHAFACGYLSECRVSEPDGSEVRWDAKSFEEAFLKVGLGKGEVVSPEAFELLREVLRIVELFISTRNARYKGLANGWEKLRRKTLNECAALRDFEEVVRMAKRLFWDNAQPISWTYDRIRAMVARLNWPADRIYCSTEVAKLIIDIDTFEKVTKEERNEKEEQIASAVLKLGFRKQGGDVLIECTDASPDIAGEQFGLFQALVREVVIPVRAPESKAEAEAAFFRLLGTADLLDFPGVANRHPNTSVPALIDPATARADDVSWLTVVFKRGKTESMVLGYARDVAIDAFVLLVRADPHPSNPRQLIAGIEHWWQCFDPGFDPNSTEGTAKAPLPLSLCLTFFAKQINNLKGSTGGGMDNIFASLPKQLLPLSSPNNSRFFATTYKHLKVSTDAFFAHGQAEVDRAAEFIRNDASFRRAFHDEVSRESFEKMIAEDDGGVDFFLEQQIAAVKSSRRQALLAVLAAKDLADLRALVEPALPSGDNDGVAQVRLMRKVYDCLIRRKDEGGNALAEQKFPELESADSQYAYLIRLLSYVDERELHPVPESFSQQKAEIREKYVTEQWKVWRRTALERLSKVLSADWGGVGLESKEECGQFLEAIAQQVGERQLLSWISAELDDVTSKVVSKSARREIAVAMGNIIRRGAHHLPDAAPAEPLAYLRTQFDTKAAPKATRSPYELSITDGFLAMLASFKPAPAKRPPQPGDQKLAELFHKL
jgi:hypothetical protein